MQLTAHSCEEFKGRWLKLIVGAARGEDIVASQAGVTDGSHMLCTNGRCNVESERCKVFRTIFARCTSAFVGSSFPSVCTDFILSPCKGPLSAMVAERPLTFLAWPVEMFCLPFVVVTICIVCVLAFSKLVEQKGEMCLLGS